MRADPGGFLILLYIMEHEITGRVMLEMKFSQLYFLEKPRRLLTLGFARNLFGAFLRSAIATLISWDPRAEPDRLLGLGDDFGTERLADYDTFCEGLYVLVYWICNRNGISFRCCYSSWNESQLALRKHYLGGGGDFCKLPTIHFRGLVWNFHGHPPISIHGLFVEISSRIQLVFVYYAPP